ncbi:hypothetical protein KC19_2G025200 [Ceratodon purpureus]|uniref:Secreted peptide n=1 Tax=Ceratodon purpureus TaxID=3225 RepID=A0A8T0ITA2_CERPU|nr:hypothetical protein KC19_2G025200 [Ceratodon purpureus]
MLSICTFLVLLKSLRYACVPVLDTTSWSNFAVYFSMHYFVHVCCSYACLLNISYTNNSTGLRFATCPLFPSTLLYSACFLPFLVILVVALMTSAHHCTELRRASFHFIN